METGRYVHKKKYIYMQCMTVCTCKCTCTYIIVYMNTGRCVRTCSACKYTCSVHTLYMYLYYSVHGQMCMYIVHVVYVHVHMDTFSHGQMQSCTYMQVYVPCNTSKTTSITNMSLIECGNVMTHEPGGVL